MSALRVEGYFLSYLLECSGLARSTYYYARAHPVKPTRPELHRAVAEIFSRTTNGCGHRQIAMCLRAELGVRIADKTVLKIMREMGIRCRIRRETDYHRYSSYKGVVQSMSRKSNCIDNGATKQVFGHMKDDFFRGRTWPNFKSFKAGLDAYVMYWNTQRRQVKLQGLTPEEFRNQSLVA